MLTKTTKSLFKGTYQYKIVLVCSIAGAFRSGDMSSTLEQLKKTTVAQQSSGWTNHQTPPKTQEQLDYAFKLQHQINKLKNIEVRVEFPYISVYTNLKSDIDRLIKVDKDKVKYISVPVDGNALVKDTVIMPKIPYEFRITLGKTIQNHSAFVEWAEKTPKLKLTKSCRRDLLKDRSWGGTHFYLTGDNILLMTKMHLGGSINKIERVVKA
jgi:hypothetical protein